jgi:uncharacterized alkaline shock family protein YloU
VEVTPVPADRLPCGAVAAELLTQVTDGAAPRDPAHQRTCPHCRAALAEFDELWAPVRDLAAEEVRAPADLLQSVMARIRELARNDWSAVLDDPAGRTRIAARVVGAIARLAAESVPHVSLALGGGRVATPEDAGTDLARVAGRESEAATSVGTAGSRVVIDVQISVDHGVSIHAVADVVRRRIISHMAEQTGLITTEVNVTVVDVRPPARLTGP